jgi:hypothetical protein
MMGNVELYHQARWRELERVATARASSVSANAAVATTPVQAIGLGLVRLGVRLAGPSLGRAATQH